MVIGQPQIVVLIVSNKFVPDSFTFLDWRKATEKKLREQIAKEISDEFDGDCNGCYCEGLIKAIDVVRGYSE